MATSYYNHQGRGYRVDDIVVTTTASLGAGSISNIVDGINSTTAANALWFSSGQSDVEIKFDFGRDVIIDGFTWFQSGAVNHGTWSLEGSPDDVGWTTIRSGIPLGAAASQEVECPNATGYRYYRLLQTSGITSSSPWIQDIQFRIEDVIPYTGSSYCHNLSSGNRVGGIEIVTNISLGGSSGPIECLINSLFGNSAAAAVRFVSGQSDRYIEFRLPDGAACAITEFIWHGSAATSQGVWNFEGSNDSGGTWSPISTGITLGSASFQKESFVNTTAYQWYRLVQTSGTTDDANWIYEIYFKATKPASSYIFPTTLNPGGSGYRRGEIEISSTAAISSGILENALDGYIFANNRDAFIWTSGQSGVEILFDFGPDRRPVVSGFVWHRSTTVNEGIWNFEGSDDGSLWTSIITGLTLSGVSSSYLTYNQSTPYRYYRLIQTSGTTSSSGWIQEIDFYIDDIIQPPPLSYSNPGGQGFRFDLITATQNGGTTNPTDTIDGNFGGSAAIWRTSTAGGSSWLKFDFLSPKIVRDIGIYSNSTGAMGTWDIEGSNDDSIWDTITAGFSFPSGPATHKIPLNNSTAYRYYRMRGPITGSMSGGQGFTEVLFNIGVEQVVGDPAKVFKTTKYAVITPSHSSTIFKTTKYVVVAPNPANVYKTAKYAVMAPDSRARVAKTTKYAVVAPPVDTQVYKTTKYAVMAPNPAEVYKASKYVVMAPDSRVRIAKATKYVVMFPSGAAPRRKALLVING